MGKTSFALNIAQNAALLTGLPVAIFSLEMSKEQLVNRLICSTANIDSQKLRTGNLDEDDWMKLAAAMTPLSKASIYIDDTPGIGVMDIRAKCRRLKLEKRIGLGDDRLSAAYAGKRKGRKQATRNFRNIEVS